MKTLFTFVFLLAAAPLYAQGGPGQICGIFFDYDAVGNRVKRSYDCRDAGEILEPPGETSRTGTGGAKPRKAPPGDSTQNPADFWAATTKEPILFPNPTSGAFTLQLPAPPDKPLHFHWYNNAMQILGSGTIATQEYKGDIRAWPDGIYILRVYWAERDYTYKLVKGSGTAR